MNIGEIVNTGDVGHDRSLMELHRTSLSSVLILLMLRAVGDLKPENVAIHPETLGVFNYLHLLADGQVNNTGMPMDSEVEVLHLIHTLRLRMVTGPLRHLIPSVGIPPILHST